MGRFISVTQLGDAAVVQLSWYRAPDEYIDFHNLVKINGVWKITNKTRHSQHSRLSPLAQI